MTTNLFAVLEDTLFDKFESTYFDKESDVYEFVFYWDNRDNLKQVIQDNCLDLASIMDDEYVLKDKVEELFMDYYHNVFLADPHANNTNYLDDPTENDHYFLGDN